MMISFAVGQPQPAALQRISTGIRPIAVQDAFYHLYRNRAQAGERGDRFLELSVLDELQRGCLIEPAALGASSQSAAGRPCSRAGRRKHRHLQRLAPASGGLRSRPRSRRWPTRAAAAALLALPRARARATAAAESPAASRPSRQAARRFARVRPAGRSCRPTGERHGFRPAFARLGGRRVGPASRVTGAAISGRLAIASRCAWLLIRATCTRSLSGMRSDCSRIGPATSMSSSRASWRTTSAGALFTAPAAATARRAPWSQSR